MEYENKNFLILGMGVSGKSSFSALDRLNFSPYIYDDNLDKLELKYRDLAKDAYTSLKEIDFDNIDILVKSPGIPMDNDVIKKAIEKNIDILTDLELAYRLGINDNFIVITGTNGKTTTTSLTGSLFKTAGKKTHIVGNIGVGILDRLTASSADDYFVIEASSFQLENCSSLRPKISAILNITPDHLNWHKSFENYARAKYNVCKNQKPQDYTVLNYDDPLLKELGKELASQVFYFTREKVLEKGFYLRDNYISYNLGKGEVKLFPISELNILGSHNVENALASCAIAKLAGLEDKYIIEGFRNFQGVEHRIEYVEEIQGVKYYNDSKGTNPEASIKALDALEKDIILIAGGMDKGSDFDLFIKSFQGRVKELILLGETKYKISEEAKKQGFNNFSLVDSMERAVKLAYEKATRGDKVLLSPACASWDMYESFEIRGDDFKANVLSLDA